MTRVCSYEVEGGSRVGLLEEAGVRETPWESMEELIAAGPSSSEIEAAAGAVVPDAVLRAPIERPGKILGSGINYMSHMEEEPGATLPDEPFWFSKLPSSVIGPGEAIELPRHDLLVDYEVEFAVVIGKPARRVSRDDALDHVFGYTLINDVGSRGMQFKDGQITLGKNLDTFCPMGPAIRLADTLPDPQTLMLSAHVNGELRQQESTANMRFSVAEIIEYLSMLFTLEPGDVIATGTPAGCGTFMVPPVFLADGDVVTVGCEGIGELTNPVVLASQTIPPHYWASGVRAHP